MEKVLWRLIGDGGGRVGSENKREEKHYTEPARQLSMLWFLSVSAVDHRARNYDH